MPHPFATATQDLRLALEGLAVSGTGQEDARACREDTLVLLLPSLGNRPLASPELGEDRGLVGTDGLALRPWQVPCLTLPAHLGLAWLARLPDGPGEAAAGITLAADCRFWARAAKLALELLARQRFIPSLEWQTTGGERKLCARWQPVWQDTRDAERLAALTRAMPPACRAFSAPFDAAQGEPSASARVSGAKPPGQGKETGPALCSPRTLVESFLSETVDQTLRRWLAPRTLGARGSGPQKASAPLTAWWVRALAAQDPAVQTPDPSARLRGSGADPQALQEAVARWTAELRNTGTAFRTCLRLEPPEEGEASGEAPGASRVKRGHPRDWTLRFFLQARDDRSLLVPARQVWQERGNTLRFLNRSIQAPQERLLTDLGRSARLFPPLEESLKQARPETCRLTTDQAYAFLKEAAPLLEESGLGVLVPPWWQDRRAALGLRLQVRSRSRRNGESSGRGTLGRDSLLNYQWQLALGDQTLSWEDFQELARLKVPLVQVRGQWVELSPEQVEAALKLWEPQRHQGEMTLGEALRLGLDPAGQMDGGLPVTDFQPQGWLEELFQKLAAGEQLPQLETPAGFRGQLRPYQVRGFSWLAFLRQWGLGACLADDMGLGKTIQFLALLLRDKEARGPRARPRPVLLICPTSVVGNWQREAARFAPALRVMVHHGAGRASGEGFRREATRHDLVISTYTLAHRDTESLSAVAWEGVALDEAQNVKNPEARQTQAIRRIPAGFRVALTGTPVENRLTELWSIMELLNPGLLGSRADFRRRFAIPIERYQDSEKATQLKRLVQPFVLRRLKTDRSIIQDLPDKLEMKSYCPLTREQVTLYEAVLQDMLRQIEEAEGMERRGLVLATLLKLKQVCNHPAHFLRDHSPLADRSGKLERLGEMLEEVLAEGDRALIFTQFAEMGQMLRDYLQSVFHREALFLHGRVRQKERDRLVARFQQDGTAGPPFFILSLKAGGVGLNLTAASHVFHFDRWWNPAVENQATDRAFRIGQQKKVQVHKFICAGTMEERIDQLIESKQALAENIIGTGEGWLTELSTDELRDIFTLRREMVAAA